MKSTLIFFGEFVNMSNINDKNFVLGYNNAIARKEKVVLKMYNKNNVRHTESLLHTSGNEETPCMSV